MKIVSLAPSNTEILYRIGAGENIVATTDFCDFPPEAEKTPSVGGWLNPGIDDVREYNPDLVLASDDLQDRAVRKLEEEGLEVLQLKPQNLNELFESIETIGKTVGKEKEAKALISGMRTEINQVDLSHRRIYCEEWTQPPMVSGNWIPELIRKSGGKYFIEGGRSRKFELEDLKEFDPEHIFLNVCGSGENVDPEVVSGRDDWKEISAVENGNIHVIDDSLLNRPGPRVVKGLQRIRTAIEKT